MVKENSHANTGGAMVLNLSGCDACVTRAINNQQVERGQLYRLDDDGIFLEWALPVLVPGPQGALAVAVILLRTRAADFLYPLVQTWPVASDSGESLLVRRQGDAAVYLNNLRHRAGTALVLQADLTNLLLSGARAVVVNAPGTLRGVDYRGADVLAAYLLANMSMFHCP